MVDDGNKTSRDVVFFMLLLIFVSLFVYDVAAARLDRWYSVTELIRDWSKMWPVIPFAAGFLCGHLWG